MQHHFTIQSGEVPLDGLIGAITFFTQREVNKGWQTRHESGTTRRKVEPILRARSYSI